MFESAMMRSGGALGGKGPLVGAVGCLVVAVVQQVVTNSAWYNRGPLTLVNMYPHKREVFRVLAASGGSQSRKKRILGVLGGSGGHFKVYADEGDVYGWRRVTKQSSDAKAKEETVVVSDAIRPTYVLGSNVPRRFTLSNRSPTMAMPPREPVPGDDGL